MMLTYLDRPPSEHCFQRCQRLMFVAVVSIGCLAIETTPRCFPSEIVYNC